MTTLDLVNYLGRKGTIRRDGLAFEVQILDVKEAYGKVRFLVTPMAGEGESWMENVNFPTEAP